MPIRVQIPGPLRPLTGGASEVEVETAADLTALISLLDERHRGVRDRLLEPSGALRKHVRIFVNDEDVRALQQESTPLSSGDRVAIVPASGPPRHVAPAVRGGAPPGPVPVLAGKVAGSRPGVAAYFRYRATTTGSGSTPRPGPRGTVKWPPFTTAASPNSSASKSR